MTLPRRDFLGSAISAATVAMIPRFAWAQSYPARPVRIIVGLAPGGTTDIIARLIAQWLSERLGQPFVIENRPGAGTGVATQVVVNAAPDGYTLLLVNASNMINTTLYQKLNIDFVRDIAPVASISREASVLVVHPSFPAKTVPEFITYAKAHPGKINMASAGNGSGPHMTGELFKMMAGVEMLHVPYRGGAPALNDLLAGHVQVYFGTTTGLIEHIRAGRLRALAVTTANRSEALPNLPTVGEFVSGYEASTVFGLGAPRNTSPEIVGKLNREINGALADATFKKRFADFGTAALAGSPTDFGQLIVDETEKWAKVIRAANIKPE